MNKHTHEKGEKGFLALVAAVCLVCLAAAVKEFAAAPRLSGQGTVPVLCALVMAVLAAVCLLRAKGSGAGAKETLAWLFPGRVGQILLCCLGYALLLGVVGFALSSLAFLALTLMLLEPGKKGKMALIAVLTTFCVLAVFRYLFQVPLP